MVTAIKKSLFGLLATLAFAVLACHAAHAAETFAVESFTKYDSGATSYTVPSSVNLVVVKKASSDFVIWTRGELSPAQLTVIESYVRHNDPSLHDSNAIFISGTGSHYIDTMYGTVTFEDGTYGLAVSMPRTWSHLDYGRYTDETTVPEPEPDPEPGRITLTKTVNGGLWRVGCDYMAVDGQETYKSQRINGTLWKRDYITNPEGKTSLEGHRLNKCGDDENWVIWTDQNGVPYRMDEIKSGATGSTLPTVVYRTKAPMTDEEIANIGNPDHPEYLEKYKRNFQDQMPYSEIRTGQRLYWITFNAGRIWYHTGIPYPAEPSFVLTIDGVEYTLTGGQSVTVEDLEPGIHDISESPVPMYSLGTVVSSTGGVIQGDNSWMVQIQVNAGDDIQLTWPNIQPGPATPPTPPAPPEVPAVHDDTLCELLDFGKRFNAVVFGSLATSGGDCEGNLLVWGSATLPTGYSVGYSVVGEQIPAPGPRDDTLIVGGDLSIGPQDINGHIAYGGAYLGTDRWDTASMRHVTPVTLDRAGNVPADGSGRTAADLLAAVTEVSARVFDFEENGTIATNSEGCLILTGADERRNVFTVTAAQWSGSQRDWIFDVPSGSKIVVNVTGASVEIRNGSMIFPAGVTQADILVNYVNATSLSFSGFNHVGSVLAPFASGSFSGGAIEGIAILGGDVVTKDGFEFHNYGLNVFFCPTLPAITVTATAAGAADGDILYAGLGASVDVTVVVGNPGDFWLRGVTLTDSTGATFDLGDIAPGGSTGIVQTLAGNAEGLVTYTATATAAAYDASNAAVVASRPSVTACDVAVVNFAVGASAGAGNGTGSAGNSAIYNPTERADYEVAEMWFSCTPTFAGENFTVNVRVVNNGDVDGDGAFLGLYLVGIDHKATIDDGEDIEPVRTLEMGRIPAKGSRIYSFGGLTAPDASGVCRAIAYADMNKAEIEWSEGDNQNNLTYELSQISIDIAVDAEGVVLTWSNGWGQKYTILGSNNLQDWFPVIEDIPSARDTEGLVENVQRVGFDSGYQFFKLRIDQR